MGTKDPGLYMWGGMKTLSKTPFNINECVEIQLTEKDLKVLQDYYESFGLAQCSRVKQDNWMEIQLWELMNIFGPQMYNGNPDTMFTGNQIILRLPDADCRPGD